MGELRSGMSGGGAGNRREVGEVAVVAGGGVGIGERRPRNRRPVGFKTKYLKVMYINKFVSFKLNKK